MWNCYSQHSRFSRLASGNLWIMVYLCFPYGFVRWGSRVGWGLVDPGVDSRLTNDRPRLDTGCVTDGWRWRSHNAISSRVTGRALKSTQVSRQARNSCLKTLSWCTRHCPSHRARDTGGDRIRERERSPFNRRQVIDEWMWRIDVGLRVLLLNRYPVPPR